MVDPYHTPSARQLYAEQDALDAELQRDLDELNYEIQGIYEDLTFWRSRHCYTHEQASEQNKEMNELHSRLMSLTRKRMNVLKQQMIPHDRVWPWP